MTTLKQSHTSTTLCLACQAELFEAVNDTYSFCTKCGSANYISKHSAEEDNNYYFNNLQVSPNLRLRTLLFSLFNRLDRLIHLKEWVAYESLLKGIEEKIDAASISVEVGFGSGDELIERLARGANCYGIDLSSKVVQTFKERYPNYSNRVSCEPAGRRSLSCDLVYSNALFEHLDHPNEFLLAAHEQLQSGGILVLRIPIKIDEGSKHNKPDINYWKPCHRAIYSMKGIESILTRNGYRVLQQATLPYYGYKVMNQLLKNGYTSIQDIRCPYAQIPNLNLLSYLKALISGLFTRLSCVEYSAIAVKV